MPKISFIRPLLFTIFLFLTFTMAPVKTAIANTSNAHKNIHANIVQKGPHIDFTTKKITCHKLQPSFCVFIVNTTDKPIDIYFDGKYLLTLNAGTDMGTEFTSYETHIYTIPLVNSRATLTVTATT